MRIENPMIELNMNGIRIFTLPVALFLVLIFSGCEKVDQDALDQERIERYLADNNLVAQKTSSGLHYIIEDPGSGGAPTVNNIVTVYYEGFLLDGTVFDGVDRPNNPLSLNLWQTIQGWQEGIPLFEKGGKGKLIIPSAMGYGNQEVGIIPKNSVLVFDIELVDWQ